MSLTTDSIKYYWLERGCLDSLSGWDKEMEKINKKYPELIKAYDDYIMARKILTIVVNNLPDGEDI